METILDALKAMGKTTCRELAARMKIEPREALEMLKELEGLEAVNFLNGYWSLPGDVSPAAAPKTKLHQVAEPKKPAKLQAKKTAKPKTETRQKVPRSESVLSQDILSALEGESGISTEALTAKTGRKSRSLNAALGFLAKEGLVERRVDKNNITWSLPGAAEPDLVTTDKTFTQEPVLPAPAEPVQEKASSTILDDIPVFVSRPDDLIIPTVRGVNREIRRAKAKVASLERLRDAVRELGRHKNLIREVLL